MKIKVGQIRAARAMLNWSQKDLAARAGVSDMSIMNYESGKRTPHQDTLEKILQAFEIGGIELTDDGGVRPRLSRVSYYSGADGFQTFFDDVYSVVKNHQSPDVCIANADEKLFQKWLAEYEAFHINRMSELNITPYKVLLRENDTNLRSSAYSEFRWAQSDSFASTCIYIYGDKTAFIDFSDDNVTITLIDSVPATTALRRMFDAAWGAAIRIGEQHER